MSDEPPNPNWPLWRPGRGLKGEEIGEDFADSGPEEIYTFIQNTLQHLGVKIATLDLFLKNGDDENDDDAAMDAYFKRWLG